MSYPAPTPHAARTQYPKGICTPPPQHKQMSVCAGRSPCGVVVQATSWAVPTESGVQLQPGLLSSSLWVPAGLSAKESFLAVLWLLNVLSPPPCGLDASRQAQLRAGLRGSIHPSSVLDLGCSGCRVFPGLVLLEHLSPFPKSGVLCPSSKTFQHHLDSESDFGLRGMCKL